MTASYARAPMRSSRLAFAIAFVTSTILWMATSIISRKVEPWDANGYWTIAYPLAIALAGVLGYLAPDRPWRWAAIIMFTQVIVMIGGGAGLGLLPLGLVVLALLTVPAIAVAKAAASFRIRQGSG